MRKLCLKYAIHSRGSFAYLYKLPFLSIFENDKTKSRILLHQNATKIEKSDNICQNNAVVYIRKFHTNSFRSIIYSA